MEEPARLVIKGLGVKVVGGTTNSVRIVSRVAFSAFEIKRDTSVLWAIQDNTTFEFMLVLDIVLVERRRCSAIKA